MRGAQRRRGLGFPLEPQEHAPRLGLGARAEQFRTYELDGGRTLQQLMLAAPHFAHAAAPQQLDQMVAAHLLCLTEPPSQPIQQVRRQNRHHRARVVGHEQHERADDGGLQVDPHDRATETRDEELLHRDIARDHRANRQNPLRDGHHRAGCFQIARYLWPAH